MKKAFEVIHPKAAGIDIGSEKFFVDAGEDIKNFSTYTEGCNALRDYLISLGITTAVMESTGVYWIVLYNILEDAGIDVWLVNGRDSKNVPGRKSDVKDCQWLRQLHTYGLFRKSFIPHENFKALRSLIRLRQDHIRASSTQIHLMQKALTQMNIRLTEAINDIVGVSGLRMIRAIIQGEREPGKLVLLCDKSILKNKKGIVLKALEGNYKPEQVFALTQAVKIYDYYRELIKECDQEIEKILTLLSLNKPQQTLKNKTKPVRYNKPEIQDLHQKLINITEGKDPTGIAGITCYSFLQLLAEFGNDLSRWPTEKHFVSWLKLAPANSNSGKVNRKLRIKNRSKGGLLFRNIAQGLLTSKHIGIGSFGRKIRAKKGSPVAVKAVARKLACYYYRVMTKGIDYVERGIEWYEAHLEQKSKKYLEKLALKHNMLLVAAQE